MTKAPEAAEPRSTSCSPTRRTDRLALRAARRRRQRRAPGSRAGRTAPRAASAAPRRRAGARRRRALGAARPPRATGASPIPAWESSWLFRRLHADLPRGRRDRRRPDLRRRRSTGAPSARRASPPATCSTRWRRRTSRGRTPRSSRRASTRAARTSSAARAASCATSRGLPATVDTSKFEVGENLALTPGLGRPAHRGVRADPVHAADRARSARCRCCSSPPTINKYYVLDLAPGPQHGRVAASQQGQQVFVISWRNPDAEQGHFDLDTYAQAVLEARDAVAEHHRPARRSTSTAPARAGSSAPARSATSPPRAGSGEIASLTPAGVPRSTTSAPGTAAALASRELAAAAVAESARRGYLDGQALDGRVHVAAPERPGLELRRQQLPAGQGAAGVRRPATGTRTPSASPPACTATSSSIGARERARAPGRARGARHAGRPRRGRRRQLHRRRARPTTSSRGRTPTAARSCSAATPRFVLSTSGHIQALVNPPAPDSRSSYRVADALPGRRAEAWAEQAATLPRQLVARLRPVARRALRRAQARAQAPRQRPPQGAGQGARQLRPRVLRGERRCPRPRCRTHHLGEALATDYFHVRDQFTDEQWEHFIAHAPVRRRGGAAGDQRVLGGAPSCRGR